MSTPQSRFKARWPVFLCLIVGMALFVLALVLTYAGNSDDARGPLISGLLLVMLGNAVNVLMKRRE